MSLNASKLQFKRLLDRANISFQNFGHSDTVQDKTAIKLKNLK